MVRFLSSENDVFMLGGVAPYMNVSFDLLFPLI
jgi:hypothetical protein